MKIKSKNTSATGHNARAGEQQALRAAQTRFPASVSRQPMHRERAPECSTEKHELGWVARDLAPVIAQRSVKQQPRPISCDRIKSFTSLSHSECCTGPHLESLTRPQGARRTHKLLEAASGQVEQDVVNCPSCLCAAEPKNTSEQSAEPGNRLPSSHCALPLVVHPHLRTIFPQDFEVMHALPAANWPPTVPPLTKWTQSMALSVSPSPLFLPLENG